MNDQTERKNIASSRMTRAVAGLSTKLLLLTILFVMVAEVLVFVPSVSNFRKQWLMERLQAAQIASVAAEAAPDGRLPEKLREELLERAGVKAISVKHEDQRVLVVQVGTPAEVETYDLRDASWAELIADALMVYVRPGNRVIRVVGEPDFSPGEMVDVVLDEAPLKAAMQSFGLNILGLSILISIITATLVFLALDWLLVKPMTQLT
ncbi:MAG: sensor histidine kinase, partial [Pseudomonadota bacterium]